MKTNQKVNGPMMIAAVVIATGVFLLLALVTYERDHYENPQLYPPATNFIESTFYAVSHAQFASLGGAAYFLVTIALAWAVIVFFRERDGEMLIRGAGTAVLVCASATLFALWGSDDLGGAVGAGIASVLSVFPGTIVGSILMSILFVGSFIVATDWLFYSALREAVSGPDLMNEEQTAAPLPSMFESSVDVVDLAEPEVAEDEEGDEVEEDADEPQTAAIPALGAGVETEERGEDAQLVDDPDDETPEAAAPADDGEHDGDEDRIHVTKPGAAATEAAVPAALRQALGAGHGTIEVEPSDVEFADEDEPEASPASVDPWTSPAAATVEDEPTGGTEVESEIEPEGEPETTTEVIPEPDETANVLGEESDEVRDEDDAIEAPPALEAEVPTPDEVRVAVGHRGHQIDVEPSDVEFAEPGLGDVLPSADAPLPELVEEEIFVDGDALSRMGPAPAEPEPEPEETATSEVTAEEEVSEETTEEPEDEAPPAEPEPEPEPSPPAFVPENRLPPPEPEPEESDAHLGLVLEDEVIEWGAAQETPEPTPEPPPGSSSEPEKPDEPTSYAGLDDMIVPGFAPPPLVEGFTPAEPMESPAVAVLPAEPEPEPAPEPVDKATAKVTDIFDSLLGPAPAEMAVALSQPAVTVTEPEVIETEPPTIEAPEPEVVEETEPETAEPEETADEADDLETADVSEDFVPAAEETPEVEPEVDVEPEDEVAAPEEAPEPEPVGEPAPEVRDEALEPAEPAEPAESVEATPKTGLLSWFRRRREETEETAAPATRPRRRDPETPSMFDAEPDASALAPDRELLDRAARLAIERRSASVVLFQIKLSIGYHRARALIGRLVDAGVIGPMGEAGSHPVLMTEEAWEEKSATMAS